MIRLEISADAPGQAPLDAAVAILRNGGVVAVATDTLYGLAADPRRDDAVGRLFDAKGRDEGMPVPLIAADIAQAEQMGEFGEIDRRLAQQFWPGPLTIVVPARPVVAARALAGGSTVALRVPAHPVARALCRAMGCALTATSANLAGEPAPASASEIDARLARRIDAILDSGPTPGGPPSTIVSGSSRGLRLLRAGAIAWDRVLKSLE